MFSVKKEVAAFLHYGYVPHSVTGRIEEVACKPYVSKSASQQEDDELSSLVAAGVDVLRRAITETLARSEPCSHVVPLSGGLDSRAILGGLLEDLDARRIQVITFGTPGTWDYEIGQVVARTAGVRCETIDLTSSVWKWDADKLVATAAQAESPIWVFDAYVNRAIPERFGPSSVYWSGFMGDPLAGSHLLKEDSRSWEQASTRFIERNCFCRSMLLTPATFRAEKCLPAKPLADSNTLTYDEQLDFTIRQQCLIRHIVLPTAYDYRTPFLHPAWVGFILSVPRRYREKQSLYEEILKAAYPRLFSLPTKNGFGLPLAAPRWRRSLRRQRLRARARAKRFAPWINWGMSPNTNYIDFDRGLRERADLKAVVYESIQDLKKRRIVDWIDIDAIWDRHQKRRANHADALTLLASLEINLKAQEMGISE